MYVLNLVMPSEELNVKLIMVCILNKGARLLVWLGVGQSHRHRMLQWVSPQPDPTL